MNYLVFFLATVLKKGQTKQEKIKKQPPASAPMNAHCSSEVTAIKSLSKRDLNWRRLQGRQLRRPPVVPAQVRGCGLAPAPRAEHLRTSNADSCSFPGLTKAFHVKNAAWECQGRSSGYIPVSLAALPASEHGEKPCLWNSRLKGNRVLLSLPSHVANHNTASRIRRAKKPRG